MAKVALIRDGIVQEIVELQEGFTLKDSFHPDAGFVDCDDRIKVGQSFRNGKFGAPPPPPPIDEKAAWERIRSQRNDRLKASDWTQFPDAPAGAAEKWKAYRQALRDIPKTYTDLTQEIPWPEEPK